MILFLLTFLFFQDTTPFKPNDEFELKMDYEFRQRTLDNSKAVDYSDERPKVTGPLPYLGVELKIVKAGAGETKVRVTNNKNTTSLNKKLKGDLVLKFDLGFTDDMKDRVTPHEYIIAFLGDESKQPLSKIVIFVEENGTLLVNGEKRGKL
jgi:hypothetical protein